MLGMIISLCASSLLDYPGVTRVMDPVVYPSDTMPPLSWARKPLSQTVYIYTDPP